MNTESPKSKHEKDLFRIMRFSTELSFGVLAALLYSLKDMSRDPHLELSLGTLVVFAVAWGLGWVFWWWIRNRAESDNESKDH